MDPYSILGLSSNTDFNEVRARYFYLAKKHHPDKLDKSISSEEKKKNEDYFKNITVAYHEIDRKKNASNNGHNYEEDFWKHLEEFFNTPETWECMKDILYKISSKPKIHKISLKLSLEDIHNSKLRKLRLFLTGIKQPVYLTINSSDIFEKDFIEINNYKIDDTVKEINIIIELSIENHKVFRLMHLINRWDLFYEITITWIEYIQGKSIIINYLNNENLNIEIPAYYNTDTPFIIENKGLSGKGDLFIIVKIYNPKNLQEFKETLDALVMEPRL